MPQVSYIDLHCDTITRCCGAGSDISLSDGQVNAEKLKRAGCAAQCFAIFTNGKNAAADFKAYAAFYNDVLNGGDFFPVRKYSDFIRARLLERTGAILTVENLGFSGGDPSGIERLAAAGAVMASLVWNDENAYARPNIVCRDGVPDCALRETRGLTPLGKETVEALNRNKIIVDISHLSDGGVRDVLKISGQPVVASHSNADAVFSHPRNLTDWQIRGIAESGGVIGLNFSSNFIGRIDAFEGLFAHFLHIVAVGGEDVVALGSDFDGIEPYPELCDCTRLPALFGYFHDRGVPPRLIDKFASENFLRVFKDVRG